MAKASIKVTKSHKTTVTRTKYKKKNKGNPNKCPVCGKFMSK